MSTEPQKQPVWIRKHRLVSVIPAPPDMVAVYADHDGGVFTNHVDCLGVGYVTEQAFTGGVPTTKLQAEEELSIEPYMMAEWCEPCFMDKNLLGYWRLSDGPIPEYFATEAKEKAAK